MTPFLRREHRISRARVRTWVKDLPEDFRPGANAHAGVEVAWIRRGTARYEVGTRAYEAHAGDVVVVPETMEHRTAFIGPVLAGSTWLDAEFVRELAELTGGQRFDQVCVAPLERTQRLGRLLEEENPSTPSGRLAADGLVEALGSEIVRALSPSKKPSPTRKLDNRIRRALEAMRERSTESLDLETLAAYAEMSPSHFCHLFSAQVGQSPYQRLQTLRLERARDLLRNRRVSVTEAALGSGFSDVRQFNRLWKRAFGVTPSRWRAQV